jgi:hypothetical protein
MRALSTAALLDAWERGVGQSLSQRALALLGAACPDTPPAQLARLPMGERDRRLLTLRELTFGSRVNGVVQCRRCLAQLELAFDAAETMTAVADESHEADPDTFTLAVGDIAVRFRLPNTLDLAAITSERHIGRARQLLLRRCVLAMTRAGAATSIDEAPPAVVEAITERMAQVDPQSDVHVKFACPSCGDERAVAFDIASFLWSEVDAWASRTFLDVHTLAKAYGWREADILAMSPSRRQHYLDLVS